MEDPILLHLELGVAEHALLLQRTEVLELSELGRPCRPCGGAGCCLRRRRVLLRPAAAAGPGPPSDQPVAADTRLDTAVAVPATTAALAIPLIRPGMIALLSRGDRSADRLGGVQGGEDRLDGDPAAGDQLTAGPTEGGREGCRPDGSRRRARRRSSSVRAPSPPRPGRWRPAGPRRRLGRRSGRARRRRRCRSGTAPTTFPSSALLMNARSRMRMRPRSARSMRMGNASPVILLPGNSTTR